MGSKLSKVELTTVQIRTIATLSALGKNKKQISDEIGLSTFLVTRALSSEEGKTIRKVLIDSAVEAAVIELKGGLSELIQLTLKVIRQQLEKSNLNAIPYVYKALGVETQDPVKPGNQTLTIVMPGAKSPDNVIEVQNEDVTERDRPN